MGTNKRKPPATVAGGPKERHKRAQRHGNGSLSPQPASGLGAKRPLPKPKDKHHSYLEFVENKDRKKKLDFTNIFTRNPPEGYVFIPVGNPALTNFCKELSREQGVKVYFVSVREPHRGKGKASPEAYQTQNCGASGTQTFANQMSRMGFHFLSSIVDKARECLSLDPIADFVPGPSQAPEPIPESQTEYHAQVDGVLRDLFPRIPNTDRQIIIDHAFTRRERYRGEPPVGLSTSMTLARRVQLAVLAHIRHTHTRYDELLRELPWHDARRVVQTTCLDFLVKWRGDEETGRDQLEEILREVVVISDSEDDESTDDESLDIAASPVAAGRPRQSRRTPRAQGTSAPQPPRSTARAPDESHTAERLQRRGFKRYAAVQQAWEAAVQRNREPDGHPPQASAPADVPNVTTPFHENERRAPLSFSFHGRAPSSNGYVPHTVSRNASVNRAQAPYAEVHFAARPSQVGPSAPLPPTGDKLKDLVVPSIEGVAPPFAPGVTNRNPDRMEHPGLHLGTGPYEESLPVPATYSAQYALGPGQRSASDWPPYRRISPVGYRTEGVIHPLPRHDQGVHGPEPRNEQALSCPRSHDAQADGATLSPGRFVPDRIVVNAAPPGSRLNPIVMEDRGGFYERVAVPEPAGAPGRQVTDVPARHRVVSGEEGSRILRETQGNPGVEVIPISRTSNTSHGLYPSNSSAPDLHPGNSWEPAVYPGHGRPRYADEHQGYAPQPEMNRLPPPSSRFYREGQRNDVIYPEQPFQVPFEGETRHYQGNRPSRDPHAHFSQEYPARIPYPDGVHALR